MTSDKIIADRAALAARLRGMARSARPRGWLVSNLLAAAAELERPRPRVEWEVYDDRFEARIVGHGRRLCAPLIRDTAESYRADLLAAGFDVDPLPEVSDAG